MCNCNGFTTAPTCTYLFLLSLGLISFAYNVLDQGLVLVGLPVCSLVQPAHWLHSHCPHDQQGPFVGLEVVPSLKPQLLCEVHWVVLVLPLTSYGRFRGLQRIQKEKVNDRLTVELYQQHEIAEYTKHVLYIRTLNNIQKPNGGSGGNRMLVWYRVEQCMEEIGWVGVGRRNWEGCLMVRWYRCWETVFGGQ